MTIQRIALIGLGAIGTVYGNLLYQKYGSDFAVIAGEARGERLKQEGVRLNQRVFFPRVISPQEKGSPMDLVIVCVKNYQLDSAMDDIRNFVGKHTVILPLLNGITARDRISAAFPGLTVLYGLSIHIDAVRTPAGVVNTVNGEIQFGNAENSSPDLKVSAVQAALSAAGIQAEICEAMIRTMWKKWMLNVGCNQVSAVTGATYGRLAGIESNRVLFHEAMAEVLALAAAAGVNLTEQDLQEFESTMRTFSPGGKTSMLQDVEAKRQTEVEYFSGTAEELGEKLGVPTPVNHVLHCVIRSLEQTYGQEGSRQDTEK